MHALGPDRGPVSGLSMAAIQAGGSHPTRSLIRGRYELIDVVGIGGSATVYRALDRLDGDVVTLKRLRVASGFGVPAKAFSGVLADLGREFELLATLRHPNVVDVLDYGFDEAGQPFLTMKFEEGARTIVEAARGRDVATKIDLLVQILRAIAYFHRHGILHGDLKPDNVVVVRDRVKVLDFGLSVRRSAFSPDWAGLAGTPLYLAPELLAGEAPTERSDLYALGLVAHEMLCGALPPGRQTLREALLPPSGTPMLTVGPTIDPRLRSVLTALLDPAPHRRPADAMAVISALEASLGWSLAPETPATRESFLESAPFVGRAREITTVRAMLEATVAGQGGVLVVGGESGVGKTRLLSQARIGALVSGIAVAAGRCLSEGGGPFHMWRDVITALALQARQLEDTTLAVLATLVPTLPSMLRRSVLPPPEVDGEAARTRFFLATETLLRGLSGPTLVLLEDLQWSGSESLDLLRWLADVVKGLPVLITATYRDDEAPQIPEVAGPAARSIRLERMSASEIQALAQGILGTTAVSARLVAFLERETEGNPFFVVEVVRSLSEGVGSLHGVSGAHAAKSVLSDGMRRLIAQRLARLSPPDREALEAAAICGRTIWLPALTALYPRLDPAAWLGRCGDASVLERHGADWSFSHDKVREVVLAELGPDRRRILHRHVAATLERHVRGDAAILAHHWQMAGDDDHERPHRERAGREALRQGACAEAITHLQRALEITDRCDSRSADRATDRGSLRAALAEAHFRIGEVGSSICEGEAALRLIGEPVPGTALGWGYELAREVLYRAARRAGVGPARTPPPRHVARDLERLQPVLSESWIFQMRIVPTLWFALRTLNQEKMVRDGDDDRVARARAYINLAMFAGSTAATARLGGRWYRRAMQLVHHGTSLQDRAWVTSRGGVFLLETCRWEEAESAVRTAMEMTEDLGDVRLWEECRQLAAAVGFYTARFPQALALFREGHRSSLGSGNRQIVCWALLGQGDILVRLGRAREALPLYASAFEILEPSGMRSETAWGLGMWSLAHLRNGDAAQAFTLATRALTVLRATAVRPYWLQHAIAAVAEVFLTLRARALGRGGETPDNQGGVPSEQLVSLSREACRILDRFALVVPLGRAHANLWRGVEASSSEKPDAARRAWERALRAATRLGLPYEEARTHLEVGLATPSGHDRRIHLAAALDRFAALGCTDEAESARTALRATR